MQHVARRMKRKEDSATSSLPALGPSSSLEEMSRSFDVKSTREGDEDAGVIKSGYLYRRGSNRQMKRRWFELTDTKLRWRNEAREDVVGSLRPEIMENTVSLKNVAKVTELTDIEARSLFPSMDDEDPKDFRYMFSLELMTKSKDDVFILGARSDIDRQEWMSTLQRQMQRLPPKKTSSVSFARLRNRFSLMESREGQDSSGHLNIAAEPWQQQQAEESLGSSPTQSRQAMRDSFLKIGKFNLAAGGDANSDLDTENNGTESVSTESDERPATHSSSDRPGTHSSSERPPERERRLSMLIGQSSSSSSKDKEKDKDSGSALFIKNLKNKTKQQLKGLSGRSGGSDIKDKRQLLRESVATDLPSSPSRSDERLVVFPTPTPTPTPTPSTLNLSSQKSPPLGPSSTSPPRNSPSSASVLNASTGTLASVPLTPLPSPPVQSSTSTSPQNSSSSSTVPNKHIAQPLSSSSSPPQLSLATSTYTSQQPLASPAISLFPAQAMGIVVCMFFLVYVLGRLDFHFVWVLLGCAGFYWVSHQRLSFYEDSLRRWYSRQARGEASRAMQLHNETTGWLNQEIARLWTPALAPFLEEWLRLFFDRVFSNHENLSTSKTRIKKLTLGSTAPQLFGAQSTSSGTNFHFLYDGGEKGGAIHLDFELAHGRVISLCIDNIFIEGVVQTRFEMNSAAALTFASFSFLHVPTLDFALTTALGTDYLKFPYLRDYVKAHLLLMLQSALLYPSTIQIGAGSATPSAHPTEFTFQQQITAEDVQNAFLQFEEAIAICIRNMSAVTEHGLNSLAIEDSPSPEAHSHGTKKFLKYFTSLRPKLGDQTTVVDQ